MARTISEIELSIISQKESTSQLSGLTSDSKVSIWRLWVYIVAVAIHFHEVLFDKHKTELEEIASRSIVGKEAWYADQALQFQFGYSLTFNRNTYRYYYLDAISQDAINSRIVKRASAKEVFTSGFTGIRIKVAKDNGGNLIALTPEELSAFSYYMSRIAFAGIPLDIISIEADDLRYDIRIFFDGVLPVEDELSKIESVIEEYISNIDFDGIFYRNKLIDALQSISSVKDIDIVRLSTKPFGSSNWIDIGRKHEPASGYYKARPIGPGTDDSKIQMIAE